MTKNLAAYTAPGSNYPSYISINENDGEVSVTVRSKVKTDGAEGDVAEINISSEDFVRLYNDLVERMP